MSAIPSTRFRVKLRKLTADVESKKGEFVLFGIFEQPDVGLWELIAAADWIDEGSPTDAIKFLAKSVNATFTVDERMSLSRIAVVPVDSPLAQAIGNATRVAGSDVEVQGCSFHGIRINRAVITASRRPTSKDGNATGEPKVIAGREVEDTI